MISSETKEAIAKIKKDHSILSVLAANQIVLKNGMAPCPFHKDRNPSFSVKDNRWNCFAGCGHGDVIDLLAKFADQTNTQYLKDYVEKTSGKAPPRRLNIPKRVTIAEPEEIAPEPTTGEKKIVATYTYEDANGNEVYQVVRFEPKTFSQRRFVDGEYQWGMQGVERVLYHLPQVRRSQDCFICEGERDVDNLIKMGFVATCNAGGAGKWLESYNEFLKDKDIVLCGDNDEPGQKHIETVKKSVEKIAKTVKIIKIPAPHKDVSDLMNALGEDDCASMITEMTAKAEPLYHGQTLPLKSMAELEQIYCHSMQYDHKTAVLMGSWLPSLSEARIIPGEIVVIVADTGTGKSAVLKNIAITHPHLNTIDFSLELTDKKSFERNAQTSTGINRHKIRESYANGVPVDWRGQNNVGQILTCTESRLSLKRIESIIKRSELRFGSSPNLVLIDYIQLMSADNAKSGRYERFTDIAEGLKAAAKELNIVIAIASQVSRDKERTYGNLSLTAAKDSGCLAWDSTNLLTDEGFQENMLCKMKTHTLKTNGKIEEVESKGIDSGEKECIRLRLRSGRFVECTPDHKILTDIGWIEAGKITKDHAVACCRKIEKNGILIPQARIMGWMIGDGCTLGKLPPHFTSADFELSQEFCAEVDRVFGMMPIRRKMSADKTHDEFYVTTGEKRPIGGNPMTNWFRDADLWNKRSYEKRIPQWFLKTCDDSSIAEIVGGLIDTDGSVRQQEREGFSDRTNVKFSTSSEGLAWDFIYCLTRLGIFGRFLVPEIKNKKQILKSNGQKIISKRPMYSIVIDDGRELEKFRKLIRLTPRKQRKLDAAIFSEKGTNNGDNLGFWVYKKLAEYAKIAGLNHKAFRMARCQDRRISQRKLKELIALFKNPPKELESLLSDVIYWDRLSEKTNVGIKQTFDRSVNPDNPNFVANGVIVHNSIEASCSLMLGLSRNPDIKNEMCVQVLKGTEIGAGMKIICNYDFESLRITEKTGLTYAS